MADISRKRKQSSLTRFFSQALADPKAAASSVSVLSSIPIVENVSSRNPVTDDNNNNDDADADEEEDFAVALQDLAKQKKQHANNATEQTIEEKEPERIAIKDTENLQSEGNTTLQSKKPSLESSSSSTIRNSRKNILHRIYQRSIHGRFPFHHTHESEPMLHRIMGWKVPKGLQLSAAASYGSSSSSSSSLPVMVTHVKWDPMGVLFAVAYANGVIEIYDWDIVEAAHLQSRRIDQNQLPGLVVDPILSFSVVSRNSQGVPVVILEWNPLDPDMLAVAIRSSSILYLFDLPRVAGWQQQQQHQQQHNTQHVSFLHRHGLPPCRQLRCSPCTTRLSEDSVLRHDSTVSFVDHQGHQCVLVSSGKSLFAWKIANNDDDERAGIIIDTWWKYQYKEYITAVTTTLAHDLVVLGSQTGRLAILNWKQLQRTSFSLHSIPTLLQDWLSYSGIESSVPRDGMGIRALHAVHVFNIHASKQRQQISRLVWLTSNGWVFSVEIELSHPLQEVKESCHGAVHHLDNACSIQRKNKCEILFSTQPVTYVDHNGKVPTSYKKEWVMARKPIPCVMDHRRLVWEKVNDDVTVVLPHPDQRVSGSTTSTMEQSNRAKPSLNWMSLESSILWKKGTTTRRVPISSISLGRRVGLPTCLAVHPNQEWIVIGTTKCGISIMHSHRR
jgi:hypothetical protein